MPRERTIAGIDIGSFKICTIISQVTDEGKVSVIGVSSIPSRGIKKGVVVDIDDAVEAIAESLEAAERMAGCAVSRAYVSVDGSHVTSLNSRGVVAVAHQDTEINENDVERATEAAQAISIPNTQEIIHVIPRGFVVDSQEGVRDPTGMSGIRLEVETNIIYGSTTAMRNLAKCVQQVGVDIDSLVFGGVAAAESCLTDTETELGVTLADIGGGTTDVVVFSDGSPIYAAVLPIGGQNVTNDLAVGLRTSLDDAEKIKQRLSQSEKQPLLGGTQAAGGGFRTELIRPLRQTVGNGEAEAEIDISDLGLEVTSVPRGLLENIMEARLSEIFNLLALEIKKSGLSGQLPAGLVLVGGAAQTKGAVGSAKKILKMPVRVGYPTGASGLIEEISGPAYAASIGLLLWGCRSEPIGRRFSALGGLGVGKVGKVFEKVKQWSKSFLP